MEIITQRDLILGIKRAWRNQYPGQRGNAVTEGLDQLDLETATAQQVNAIIGNESWTGAWCEECNEYVAPAVRFSSNTVICSDCITLAYHKLRGDAQ